MGSPPSSLLAAGLALKSFLSASMKGLGARDACSFTASISFVPCTGQTGHRVSEKGAGASQGS